MSEENYGQGISSEDIKKAVSMSGYPLQTEIANYLRELFYVQEEWSYSDFDTNDIRTIDINATKWLYDIKDKPRVRPILNLLIECKKSELPYIFFLSSGPVNVDFPLICGLRSDKIELFSKDRKQFYHYPLNRTLGLHQHSFLSSPHYYCRTFSKCVRKSKGIQLSGDLPYNSLILPLYKAVRHFKSVESPRSSETYFDAHLTIPIAIIDAPFVGVTKKNDQIELNNLSWVRVFRHTYEKENVPLSSGMSRVYGFDFVQREFFKEYLMKYVTPYAELFSSRIKKHQVTIANGKGYLDSDKLQPDQIESNLQYPR